MVMRILIIEDDHKIANALKKGLEQESYAVDVCYEALAGITKAMSDEYDLLILDRMLPGTSDGLTICKALRKENKNLPILILTAKDKIGDRVEGLNCGADDYLIKPFAFEELLARVKALLRRPNQQVGTVLKIEDLTLDTNTYEVKRGDKRVQLSSKEFSLLEYLMRNPNRILTKNNIIDHVWNYDADILPNTVEVYIGYLRNKIEKPFNGPELLHTIRGFGYKFGENL